MTEKYTITNPETGDTITREFTAAQLREAARDGYTTAVNSGCYAVVDIVTEDGKQYGRLTIYREDGTPIHSDVNALERIWETVAEDCPQFGVDPATVIERPAPELDNNRIAAALDAHNVPHYTQAGRIYADTMSAGTAVFEEVEELTGCTVQRLRDFLGY